jgi:uncharacterized protein with NRDE domain
LYTNPGDLSSHGKYRLILINNRDEYYKRKTLNAKIYKTDDLTEIYGTDVQDMSKQGTWLSLSKNADTIRIGNLLNVPGCIFKGKKEDLLGRGPLAFNYVRTSDDIEQHSEKLLDVCTLYNSFNFLSVEIKIKSDVIKTYFTSNVTQSYDELKSNFIGASNSSINIPLKKVIAGRDQFMEIVNQYNDSDNKEKLIDALTELLKSDVKHYPDDELTRRCQSYAEGAESFSSIFVRLNNKLYGTRTHTIILIDNDYNVDYIETTMTNEDPENAEWKVTRLSIN